MSNAIPLTPYRYAKNRRAFISDTGNSAISLTVEEGADLSAWQNLIRGKRNVNETVFLNPEDFDSKLRAAYDGRHSTANDIIEDIEKSHDLGSLFDELPPIEDLLDSEDEAPIIKLINGVFGEALRRGASDIHIEQMERTLSIRLRIDGLLQTAYEPPRPLGSMLVSRIKVMARLDIAEKRLPQDGRITVRAAGKDVDVRVSTLPGIHGERVVMRILDKQATVLTLEESGMPPATLARVRSIINKPNGIMLITGPTGSGKTTTLYSALSELNDRTKNILTIEDPVEYAVEGVGQTQVNTKAGMTFARGLRAILRQDPDVVMIGEIRDTETANIAVQASLTGHLVLSTLHTNTSLGAIVRLRDMGIEPFLLSSSIKGVMAQRLVRKLCTCKRERKATSSDIEWLQANGIETTPATMITEPNGCVSCNHSGYQGRMAIHEMVQIDERISEMIHDGASESEMANIAFSISDQKTLSQTGARFVIQGLTTIAEVVRAVSKD